MIIVKRELSCQQRVDVGVGVGVDFSVGISVVVVVVLLLTRRHSLVLGHKTDPNGAVS